MATPIPRNHAAFSVADVVKATGGTLARLGNIDRLCGITTDTRSVFEGEIFFAIMGERIDAHDHLAAAVERGAAMVVVSRDVSVPDGPSVLRVGDTTKSLGELARFHHGRWASSKPTVTVGITGSAGKTTTRRATSAVLTGLGRKVHSSSGNLNNAIGIPMTLFGIEGHHDTAVIEIGTSNRGEIAWGTSLCEPDVSVLTLVAAAHTGGIGGIEEVALEKGAIFAETKETGVAIANADDPRAVAQLVRAPSGKTLRFGGSEGADVRLLERRVEGANGAALRVAVGGHELEVRTPLLGMAGGMASIAAITVASAMGLPLDASRITNALEEHAAPDEGRLSPLVLANGTVLLDDAYNANGASMIASAKAAMEIAKAEGKSLVLVLGEMKELGELAAEEHARVAAEIAQLGPRVVIGIHGEAKRFTDTAQMSGIASRFLDSAKEAASIARGLVKAGEVVLVKGSRSVGLEVVVAALREVAR